MQNYAVTGGRRNRTTSCAILMAFQGVPLRVKLRPSKAAQESSSFVVQEGLKLRASSSLLTKGKDK